MPYALFDHNERIGDVASSELEAWRKAVDSGLISDIPVADEQGGQVLPRGLHVKRLTEDFKPRSEWNLPTEIS